MAVVQDSNLSYPIAYNSDMGVTYAYGAWQGSMPAGTPLQHVYADEIVINFFNQKPTPPNPNPPSPPPPPGKVAGTWPNYWQANISSASTQSATLKLHTDLFTKLYYSWPDMRQLWRFFDLETGAETGAELWAGTILYEIGGPFANPTSCSTYDVKMRILKRDWMNSTVYKTTNYLLGQSTSGYGNYTLSDLWLAPAVVGGETNSWTVANSTIAQPVRLEGPDQFSGNFWRHPHHEPESHPLLQPNTHKLTLALALSLSLSLTHSKKKKRKKPEKKNYPSLGTMFCVHLCEKSMRVGMHVCVFTSLVNS